MTPTINFVSIRELQDKGPVFTALPDGQERRRGVTQVVEPAVRQRRPPQCGLEGPAHRLAMERRADGAREHVPGLDPAGAATRRSMSCRVR